MILEVSSFSLGSHPLLNFSMQVSYSITSLLTFQHLGAVSKTPQLIPSWFLPFRTFSFFHAVCSFVTVVLFHRFAPSYQSLRSFYLVAPVSKIVEYSPSGLPLFVNSCGHGLYGGESGGTIGR